MNETLPAESARAGGPSHQHLLQQLDALRNELANVAPNDPEALGPIHRSHRLSACNLLHYLALRRHEIRPLQESLAEMGLSSLGRAEAHVAASLDAVRMVLHLLLNERAQPVVAWAPTFSQGRKLLTTAATRLLGAKPAGRSVRIMVTVSAEEAKSGVLIRSLVHSGMDCMRINCAHDGPEVWLALVQQLRAAEKELGRTCRILMDVGGPKLRTGPVTLGPPALKWRPVRNQLGQVIRPAIIALSPCGVAHPSNVDAQALLELPAQFLGSLRADEELELKDARGSLRRLRLTARMRDSWLAESHSTTYVTDGTMLRSRRTGHTAELSGLPRAEDPILLRAGDTLRLTRSLMPGRPAVRDASQQVIEPAFVGCTLGEAFSQLRPGLRVLIDDGKIESVIRRADEESILLEITRVPPRGAKLRGDRGLNFPEAELRLPALTPKDLDALSFIAQHADMVGFSFVQREDDVIQLQEHLARLGKPHLGIVLKIETRRAFENLPTLLWAAMRSEAVGVMIARGDLAVECGYERLAEVQEEILWLCEAAHLPVIWATQVLETLAKEGVPSRAEITDAAMSERAECVMLNKGPHIQKAVTVLDSILGRMQAHQSKKTAMLRQLRSWREPPWPPAHNRAAGAG
jgi:pyruvate kinase